MAAGVRKGEPPDTLLTRRTKALDSEDCGIRRGTREKGETIRDEHEL